MIEWKILSVSDAQNLWDRIEDETRDCMAKGIDGPSNNIDVIKRLVFDGNLLVARAYDEKGQLKGSSVIKLAGNGTAQAITVTGTGLANKQSADSYYEMLGNLGVKKIQALCQANTARLWGNVGFKPTHYIMEVNLWAE